MQSIHRNNLIVPNNTPDLQESADGEINNREENNTLFYRNSAFNSMSTLILDEFFDEEELESITNSGEIEDRNKELEKSPLFDLQWDLTRSYLYNQRQERFIPIRNEDGDIINVLNVSELE